MQVFLLRRWPRESLNPMQKTLTCSLVGAPQKSKSRGEKRKVPLSPIPVLWNCPRAVSVYACMGVQGGRKQPLLLVLGGVHGLTWFPWLHKG